MHVRTIITEAGSCVTVTHVILGESPSQVVSEARAQMRAIITSVLKEQGEPELCADDLASALEHAYWWAELGSEDFTVMIAQPEQIVTV